MAAIYEAVVRPAHGGFGEWDYTEIERVKGVRSVAAWKREAVRDRPGYSVVPAPEISGAIHNQMVSGLGYGTPYELRCEANPEYSSYHLVWRVDRSLTDE